MNRHSSSSVSAPTSPTAATATEEDDQARISSVSITKSLYFLSLDGEQHDVSNLALPRRHSAPLYPPLPVSAKKSTRRNSEQPATSEATGMVLNPRHRHSDSVDSLDSCYRIVAELTSSLMASGIATGIATEGIARENTDQPYSRHASASAISTPLTLTPPRTQRHQAYHHQDNLSLASTSPPGFNEDAATNSKVDSNRFQPRLDQQERSRLPDNLPMFTRTTTHNQDIVATVPDFPMPKDSAKLELEQDAPPAESNMKKAAREDTYLTVDVGPDGKPYLRIGPTIKVDYLGTASRTKTAIRTKKEPVLYLNCPQCQIPIRCLAQIEYVVCSQCHTISPLAILGEGISNMEQGQKLDERTGAGIGLKVPSSRSSGSEAPTVAAAASSSEAPAFAAAPSPAEE